MNTLWLLWLQLSHIPAFWIALTLLAFGIGDALYVRAGGFPLLNPVLISVLLLISLLLFTHVPYPVYFAGAQPIHILLGPATVALAIPLYSNLQRVRDYALPLLLALLFGCVLGIVSALACGQLFGLSASSLASIAPKSVTTPIAMALAQHAGGNVSLAAGFVILTGICGAVLAVPIFRLLRIEHEIAQGFALGMAAHGVGTSRAIQLSETAGAFSGLAMGLNGVLTSLLLSVVLGSWWSVFG
ncbi:LrgB family protein [Chitinibacter tainanensis]|uniref:LrgB family protein n=1 Tax=Chitinibacter tainanensis TaxID=230667 RepID=UPI002356AFD4|nr:LrgB family protein [Chitinibacter tainanensis]